VVALERSACGAVVGIVSLARHAGAGQMQPRRLPANERDCVNVQVFNVVQQRGVALVCHTFFVCFDK